jgi:hypothetical protein
MFNKSYGNKVVGITFIVVFLFAIWITSLFMPASNTPNTRQTYYADVQLKAKDWILTHREYVVIPDSITCFPNYPMTFIENRIMCKGKTYLLNTTTSFICNLQDCKPYFHLSLFY